MHIQKILPYRRNGFCALGSDGCVYSQKNRFIGNKLETFWNKQYDFCFVSNPPSKIIDWWLDDYKEFALGDNGVVYAPEYFNGKYHWKEVVAPVTKDGEKINIVQLVKEGFVMDINGNLFERVWLTSSSSYAWDKKI